MYRDNSNNSKNKQTDNNNYNKDNEAKQNNNIFSWEGNQLQYSNLLCNTYALNKIGIK